MKRKFQHPVLLLLVTASFIILSSCTKDNDDVVATKTSLLTLAPWKRTALISTPAYDWYGNGNLITNLLDAMLPCEKDNFETYRTDSFWELNEGATKCIQTDPQTWSFTWAFADNENKLVFDGFDEYVLVELTSSTLKLRQAFVENGVTYTFDDSYGH